jgi:hypothetical protein
VRDGFRPLTLNALEDGLHGQAAHLFPGLVDRCQATCLSWARDVLSYPTIEMSPGME